MLVLTRRPGEKLIFETSEGPSSIMTASASGQQARLGVNAPETSL